MSNHTLLVTGASGQLGRRVLELLLDRGAGPLVATTRTPAALADLAARGVEVRRADFDDEASLIAAFAGVERALLISTDALDRPGRRLAQQQAAVRALAAAGVRHVVYTSAPNPYEGSPLLVAADHRGTEEALAASSLDYTVLRNNLYADLLLHALPQAIASGQLIDARGDGAVALISREDCARAAAAALAGTTAGRTTLEIGGPAALTSAEIAAIVTELAGAPVVHVPITAAALTEGLTQHGLPRPVAELLVSFDVAIARGDLAIVTDSVARLTGQAPRSLREFLQDHHEELRAAARGVQQVA